MKPERLSELREWCENQDLYEYVLADSVMECLDEIELLSEELEYLKDAYMKLQKEMKDINKSLISEFETFITWKKHGLS